MNLSKTQIDLLGNRLRKRPATNSDLILLDNYRRSFKEAYQFVIQNISINLGLDPTGRPVKSTGSIINKLRRESIRLSQIQDIAGCRIIVGSVAEQDKVIVSLNELFSGANIIDRRANPKFGYRAIHVIPQIFDKSIEVQVRTKLQHKWAELSEKASDFDPTIKYSSGTDLIRQILEKLSIRIAEFERLKQQQLLSSPNDLLSKFEEILNELAPDIDTAISEKELEYKKI